MNGWLIADKETSGLAGDDIFARDPSGKWWSVEVKHVKCLTPAHMEQAISQARIRSRAVSDSPANSIAHALGITHDPNAWILVWKPSGFRNASQMLAVRGHGRRTVFELWDCADL